MKISGRVWKYGDDVNTDVIFPGRYTYTIRDEDEMGSHALEDLDPSFAPNVRSGDIIVAGKNWGCGSSRQQAVTCLRVKGIAAVVVKGVARIYYRNAINEALPIIICPEVVDMVKNGESIIIDFDAGVVEAAHGLWHFSPFPEIVSRIMSAGGLIPYVNEKLRAQRQRIKSFAPRAVEETKRL